MSLNNKGALFPAPEKPYKYSGSINIEGTEYQLFVYEATSKAGDAYYQVSAYLSKGSNNGKLYKS